MRKDVVSNGGPGSPGKKARPKKKFLTWFDINRILKKMDSPALDDFSRHARLLEYYACIGAFLRMCAHFEKIYRENPGVFGTQSYKEVKPFVQALGEGIATVSEILAEIIDDALGGAPLEG